MPVAPVNPGDKWVTYYLSVAGWKVVVMWIAPEGYPEPYEVRKELLAWSTAEPARARAIAYAEENNLPFMEAE